MVVLGQSVFRPLSNSQSFDSSGKAVWSPAICPSSLPARLVVLGALVQLLVQHISHIIPCFAAASSLCSPAGAPDVSTPDAARKASSTLSLANGSSLQQGGASGFQRKRLQAPTLAELDSSDSDDETAGQRSASSSSISTPMVEDTSPESVVGKKNHASKLTCMLKEVNPGPGLATDAGSSPRRISFIFSSITGTMMKF
ncbi:hypothetical protein NFI96_006432 [Prochilodus magdalenae]|nr:hypothetical protein NFI96_006432 [Prochilodus magdalenae]